MMNRRGFTLIEMLACLAVLGLVLGIGLYATKDTLSMTVNSLNKVSDNEVFDAAELYVSEVNSNWNIDNQGNEYTCVLIGNLVDFGYFNEEEVEDIINNKVKITRNINNKVVINTNYALDCE